MGPLPAFVTKYRLDVLVVVVAVVSAIGTALEPDPHRPNGVMRWAQAAAVVAVVLVLVGRRRFPFAAPAATWLIAAALSFVNGHLIVDHAGIFAAGLGAAMLLGNVRHTAEARLGLGIVVAGAAIIVYNDPAHTGSDLVFTPAMFVIGWLVGFALRGRAEQTEAAEERAARAEQEREAAARVAVAEERGRIARELHDVVAHAVSVMVLQVGAVRHRLPASDSGDREALLSVEQAGRTALTEMRRLLDAMRAEGDHPELVPHPGLGDLESLVNDVRAAGLDVDLRVHGEPLLLSPGLDLSAYRIVQEGLTNTLKHARAGHAEVDVHYGAGELRLQVRDDGQGPTADGGHGHGHGLVGVRERVKIYGGEVSFGARDPRGFVLCARLPLNGR